MSRNNIIQNKKTIKPILKWAGGKTQLIDELESFFPNKINKYIEPFIGGGALFFHTLPENAIISDINPELINLYNTIKDVPNQVIEILKSFKNEEDFYYEMRSKVYDNLSNTEKAARTLYLNKTCYNGLYRVNKKGNFNTPFGRYKNPNFINEEGIIEASTALKNATIIHSDYKSILDNYAEPGDLVFLDPPYLPIGKYEDFKRYTKEGFYDEDHYELAEYVKQLSELGCHVILTNSNSPLVYELYEDFDIRVVNTKRYINSNPTKRTGEDVIVVAPPKVRKIINVGVTDLPSQNALFPSTRYMGSKQSLVRQIASAALQFEFDSVLDLFSGSGVVSYMFKTLGKTVFSNDYMTMNSKLASAMIANSSIKLSEDDIKKLLTPSENTDNFVTDNFKDIYYLEEDNKFIDMVRNNISKIKNKTKRDIAVSALTRACIKKRPRGIFTYTGIRYDDGRKDLQLSFEEQFRLAVKAINESVFDNGKACKAFNLDSMNINKKVDLVYIDPPYYNPTSDNEYVRRYHFVEGIARNWQDVEMQWDTKTKKFKNYPTPFSTKNGAYDAFNKIFKRYKNSILLISYSSNSLPTQDEMVGLLSKYKENVEVVSMDYTYSFGNQGANVGNNKNKVQEYIFIAY
ncbi:Dam family site-specific DNA-(adenine-N6)-methyltransferase [Bacteroides propionicifaciens]|uniref:Dam family site-specific DNA-(adenine-N6)-methyltransferase n=2 Tax=Bacteroides propionicifaciens TaxID=392838 RepID=UPI00035CE403|nr:Dam family site-specific DNA-(adenine-N6)-methyltransferase [Bacteroides propionicifaciens]